MGTNLKLIFTNKQMGFFQTQAASYVGNEAIVKLLLKKGADVNAKGGIYGQHHTVAMPVRQL
jgi:hypothetical protein